MKKEKGITLVALIITVVIMMILAGVTIAAINGEDKNKIRDSKLISELGIVQHAVLEQYTTYLQVKDDDLLLGEEVTVGTMNSLAIELNIKLTNVPASYKAKFYRLNQNDLSKLGIEQTTDVYIVNYISGEVINETVKKATTGEPLYKASRTNF